MSLSTECVFWPDLFGDASLEECMDYMNLLRENSTSGPGHMANIMTDISGTNIPWQGMVFIYVLACCFDDVQVMGRGGKAYVMGSCGGEVIADKFEELLDVE
jgi:hypothetical protein